MSQSDDFAGRARAMAPWQYRFELRPGVITPNSDEHHDWNLRRRKLVFALLDGLVAARGGYGGQSFLDCGCNAGLWSFELHRRGARRIRAFDGRSVNVEKCELVREARGIDAKELELRTANVYDLEREFEPHDVVLALGLFYHLSNPVEVARQIAAVTRWAAVIDSNVLLAPTTALEFRVEDPRPHPNAVESAVLLPTRSALIEMLRAAGFRDFLVASMPEWAPDLYREARRTLLVALKEPLASDATAPSHADADTATAWGQARDRRFWVSSLLEPRVEPSFSFDEAVRTADRVLNGKTLLRLAVGKLARKAIGLELPLPGAGPAPELPPRWPLPESGCAAVVRALDSLLAPTKGYASLSFCDATEGPSGLGSALRSRGAQLARESEADPDEVFDVVIGTLHRSDPQEMEARCDELAARTGWMALVDVRPLGDPPGGEAASLVQWLRSAGFGSVHWLLAGNESSQMLLDNRRALLVAFKAEGPALDSPHF
jgi:SAM-dependent methyltransferase